MATVANKVAESVTGKFYVDSLVHDESMLEYIVKLFGADKVTLGSDYPFPLGELEPGKLIRDLPFDKKTKELLLGGSALNWLNMKKEKFV